MRYSVINRPQGHYRPINFRDPQLTISFPYIFVISTHTNIITPLTIHKLAKPSLFSCWAISRDLRYQKENGQKILRRRQLEMRESPILEEWLRLLFATTDLVLDLIFYLLFFFPVDLTLFRGVYMPIYWYYLDFSACITYWVVDYIWRDYWCEIDFVWPYEY